MEDCNGAITAQSAVDIQFSKDTFNQPVCVGGSAIANRPDTQAAATDCHQPHSVKRLFCTDAHRGEASVSAVVPYYSCLAVAQSKQNFQLHTANPGVNMESTCSKTRVCLGPPLTLTAKRPLAVALRVLQS